MDRICSGWRPARASCALVMAAVAGGVGGCSSDMTRLGEGFGANPFAASAPANQMASVTTPASPAPAPAPVVMQQSLPPIQTASIPQSQYVPPPQSQYVPPPQPQNVPPPQSQYVPPQQRPVPEGPVTARADGHWDTNGGTAIVVAPGDTAETIARRWRVPAQALIQANNITKPTALPPGEKLVIPRYVVGGSGALVAHATNPRTQVAPATVPVAAALPPTVPVAAAPRLTPPPSAPVSTASAAPTATASVQTLLPTAPMHTVGSGETLGKIAGKYRVKPKELALANGIRPDTPLKIGMKLAIPVKVAVASNTQTAKSAPAVVQVAQTTPSPPTSGRSEPTSNVMVAAQVDKQTEDTNQNGSNGAAGFRWPTRGRIVNNFGAKVNGATNDGIDLAVPEGTQVRAVDDGVVAYAGNELKGYGNLVLIRHSNGYVSAYANASELMVKRNDQVHKGQVILKSGQTGNATAPQLHFEIRKNSAPVDPMQYLPADKTASAPL
jgi:murein DD-endopeptidase MepM/ murein hydrolase activator NlpD